MLRLLVVLLCVVVPGLTFAASGVIEDGLAVREAQLWSAPPEGHRADTALVVQTVPSGSRLRVSCDEGQEWCRVDTGSWIRRADVRLERDAGDTQPQREAFLGRWKVPGGRLVVGPGEANGIGGVFLSDDRNLPSTLFKAVLRDGSMVSTEVSAQDPFNNPVEADLTSITLTPSGPDGLLISAQSKKRGPGQFTAPRMRDDDSIVGAVPTQAAPAGNAAGGPDTWQGSWIVDFGAGRGTVIMTLGLNPGLISGRFETDAAVVSFNGRAEGTRMPPTELFVSPKQGLKASQAFDTIELALLDDNTLQVNLTGAGANPIVATGRRGTTQDGTGGVQQETTGGGSSAAPAATGGQQSAVVSTAANVRTRPSSSNSRVVRTMKVGTEIQVRCDGRWCQLEDGNWVFADLLRFTGAVAEETEAASEEAAPDEPEEEAASFVGRWRLSMPDGSTSDLRIEQDGDAMTGSFANGTERIAFTGSAEGERAAGTVRSSGDDVELALLGAGSMIAVSIGGAPALVATGRRLGDDETDATEDFEGLWAITGPDGASQATIFQDGETVSGVWETFQFEGRIENGRALLTVSETGEDGMASPSDVQLELVLLGNGKTLAINLVDSAGEQTAVTGKRILG